MENVDYVMFDIVNQSLDLTIRSLGSGRVHLTVDTCSRWQRIIVYQKPFPHVLRMESYNRVLQNYTFAHFDE